MGIYILLSINSLTLSTFVAVINGSFLTISSTTLLTSVLKKRIHFSLVLLIFGFSYSGLRSSKSIDFVFNTLLCSYSRIIPIINS